VAVQLQGVSTNASRVGRWWSWGSGTGGIASRRGGGTLVGMGQELENLLGVHERLWKQRVEMLERWHEAWALREQSERTLDGQSRSREAELVRVSQGLSARQRAWAAQHSTYETRPRDRAGRQVLVSWTYCRKQIAAVEAKWMAILAASRRELSDTDASLAAATSAALEAWGTRTSALTGISTRRLRALAR
jgi:hypothetical protein